MRLVEAVGVVLRRVDDSTAKRVVDMWRLGCLIDGHTKSTDGVSTAVVDASDPAEAEAMAQEGVRDFICHYFAHLADPRDRKTEAASPASAAPLQRFSPEVAFLRDAFLAIDPPFSPTEARDHSPAVPTASTSTSSSSLSSSSSSSVLSVPTEDMQQAAQRRTQDRLEAQRMQRDGVGLLADPLLLQLAQRLTCGLSHYRAASGAPGTLERALVGWMR